MPASSSPQRVPIGTPSSAHPWLSRPTGVPHRTRGAAVPEMGHHDAAIGIRTFICGATAPYDADAFIDALAEQQITPVIPSHPRRKEPPPCDFALYCERNLVERFFNKLKHFRAIATRYDKLARNFLAGVHLASAIILLN
jgi:transposase